LPLLSSRKSSTGCGRERSSRLACVQCCRGVFQRAVNHRVVEPEILDRLPADDPQAVRARRDLRFINWAMGNERWICRTLVNRPKATAAGIVELGAGDGALAGKLVHLLPGVPVCACDLAPRPGGLDQRVEWRQGDVLQETALPSGGILVANLILHHFNACELQKLGTLCNGFSMLVFCEPDRGLLPHVLALTLWPWMGRVTRHDMPVSIRAGFATGELPDLLGLDRATWRVDETSTGRGARRVIACRIP